MIKLTRALLL